MHKVFVVRPKGNRRQGRSRLRLEGDIKMDLKEVGMVIVGFSWHRTGTNEHGYGHSGSIKGRVFLDLLKKN